MEDATENIVHIWRLKINKQVFLAKLALFLFYATGGTVGIFNSLFLKHRGIKIEELSTITALSVIAQLSLTPASAFIADKFAKIKTVTYFYILLFAITSVCSIFVPKIDNCRVPAIDIACQNRSFMIKSNCRTEAIHLKHCRSGTPSNNSMCENILSLEQSSSTFMTIKNGSSAVCPKTTEYEFGNLSTSLCESEYQCHLQCEIENHNSISRAELLIAYFILTFILDWTRSAAYRFIEVLQSAVAEEHNSEFGKHLMWGKVGSMVGPLLSGYLIDYASFGKCGDKYVLIHAISPIMCLVCIASMWKIKDNQQKRKTEKGRMWKKAITLLKKADFSVFCVVLTAAGCVNRFNAVFLRWYLEDLGGDARLIGFLKTANSLYAIPVLYVSKWCMDKIGLRTIFVLALFVSALYEFGYSLLLVPWPAFLLDLMRPLIVDLLWVSVIAFVRASAPDEIQTTVTVAAGLIFYSVGRVGGSLIGGNIMAAYGQRSGFVIMAIASLVAALLYLGFLLIAKFMKQKKMNSKVDHKLNTLS